MTGRVNICIYKKLQQQFSLATEYSLGHPGFFTVAQAETTLYSLGGRGITPKSALVVQ